MRTKINALNKMQFFQNFKNFFLYSSFLPFFAGLISLLCWISNTPLIGLGIFVAIACYVFVSQEDMTPIIPLLFCVIMLFRSLGTAKGLPMYFVLAPAIICILIHVIKYRYRPTFGKLFFPMIMVTIALFMGGITTYYVGDYMRAIASMISIGPGLIIVYLFFLNYIHPPKQVSLKTYFCECIVFMAFFASLQCLFLFYNQHVLHNTSFVKNELGWANINNVGTLILMAVPLCFYLMTKTEKVFYWFLFLVVFVVTTFIINSSIVLLFLVGAIPFLIVYTYYKLPNKNKLVCKNLFFVAIISVVALICISLVTDYHFIFNMVENATLGNGRDQLYAEAVDLIKRYPILGVGLGYYNEEFYFMDAGFKLSNIRVYNFHSSFLHIFATMGIVGMVAYIYYFIQRIRTFTEKRSRYSTFAFISFLLFSFHGIFDTCEFNMIPLLIVLTLIMVVAEIDSKKPLYQDHLFVPLAPTYPSSKI